jgi:serine protease AprX
MSTSRLRAIGAAGAAVCLLTSLIWTPAPLHAQGQTVDKLDSVLQEHSAQAGRSRVIVEFVEGVDTTVITARGGHLGRRLPAHRSQVAEVDNGALKRLASDPKVARVTIDRPVYPTLFRTGAATGATIARQQYGVTGLRVGIAVIDSGIGYHHDLHLIDGVARTTDLIAHFKDFTADAASGAGAPWDPYGHGTHIAGILAGSGYDSDGARRGIAPGAHLVGLKVLDAEGRGYISDVIAALDYAVAVKDLYNIRVVNVSVASGVFESYRRDPLTRAARRAVEAGLVVVAAAGNLGLNEQGDVQYGGITAPGNSPWVITVGAASHQGTAPRSDDLVASFSSRGPTWRDFVAKPDLVAPGVGIESTVDPNSTLARTHADYLLNGTQNDYDRPYLSLSGTSMATPVVAGTVALMLEANPSLTPNAVKAILQYTAQAQAQESPLAQGAGHLNVAGAVRMARFFGLPDTELGATADVIEGESVSWSREMIWGNSRVTGGVPLPGANAWLTGGAWGAMNVGRNDPVVWGMRLADDTASPTAGGRNIVWATGSRGNIVWATGGRSNIVWATGGRINVWATGSRTNIVWATGGRSNIVWATALCAACAFSRR